MRKRIIVLSALTIAAVISGFVAVRTTSLKVREERQAALEYRQTAAELPILMYHRVFDGGHKSRYIITPKQLEGDLIALKKAGYTAVLPGEVIKFVEGKGALPPRPVMLTFDDGHYNNLLYALPLFEKHGFKGVVNVIGKFCQYASTSGDRGKAASSYLAWDEVAKLERSGLFEIGSHTYNMHDYKPRFGIRRLEGETGAEYRTALIKDDMRLKAALKDNSGVEPIAFAYPFGAYYKDSRALISGLGYKMIFTTDAKVNYIKAGDFDTLLALGRFNRESDWTSLQMIEAITTK